MQKRTRTVVVVAAAVAVVLVLGAVIGPIVYARSQDAAPPPLSVGDATSRTAEPAATPGAGSTSSPSPSGGSEGTATAELDGRWTVGDGSQAGYRVDEVLNGEDVTVVGRTDQVTGTAEVADGALTAAVVEVDVASIATDSERRDGYFTGTAMRASEHPTATFTLTEPVTVPELGEDPVQVEADGELELVGQAREVTATIEVVRDGEDVAASGSIDVTFEDWGIEAPNLGFVQVEDTGQVEFLVQLTR
ncbi:YceI family protein [Auraticoccus monumenti]|uniref:Polyisoprenoid-binding protein YceI n=1 Tax=Auraticoccus monumenti TaxID=675864 RepID=A0A1G6V659_9ACTN|nr:YceI family protein [Auraticoccus monumenti]SDD49082.1 Polyisoprenoid-binding protein YceI [Auraticoccus monumenti]